MTNFNSSWSGFVISFSFPVFFWIAGPLGERGLRRRAHCEDDSGFLSFGREAESTVVVEGKGCSLVAEADSTTTWSQHELAAPFIKLFAQTPPCHEYKIIT